MINIFIKLLKNKYFLIWLTLFVGILFFIYNPILNFKSEYMEIKEITNFIYIFYVFLLPMSFFEMGFTTCLILDLCYLSIVTYIVVNFINYFFVDSSSITLTRVDRKKWINNILKINILFSILISIIYILFFIILCISNDINISLEFKNFVPIIYKLLITIIIPDIYLLFYIKTDSSVLSLGFFLITYICLELLIKATFNELSLSFSYPILLIILLITIYICVSLLILKLFKRRDI